jgi:hypothetical protein
MTRTFFALALALLLVGPAFAEPEKSTDRSTLKTDTQRLDDLQRQLTELQAKLTASLDTLKDEVKELRRDTNATLTAQTVLSELKALKEQMAAMQKEMLALRVPAPAVPGGPESRTSLFVPTPPTAGMGRVVLKNTFPDRVTVVANGRPFPLDPGAAWTLEPQPAGSFTYEVLGGPTGLVQPRRTTSLAPGETLTINVYER